MFLLPYRREHLEHATAYTCHICISFHLSLLFLFMEWELLSFLFCELEYYKQIFQPVSIMSPNNNIFPHNNKKYKVRQWGYPGGCSSSFYGWVLGLERAQRTIQIIHLTYQESQVWTINPSFYMISSVYQNTAHVCLHWCMCMRVLRSCYTKMKNEE